MSGVPAGRPKRRNYYCHLTGVNTCAIVNMLCINIYIGQNSCFRAREGWRTGECSTRGRVRSPKTREKHPKGGALGRLRPHLSPSVRFCPLGGVGRGSAGCGVRSAEWGKEGGVLGCAGPHLPAFTRLLRAGRFAGSKFGKCRSREGREGGNYFYGQADFTWLAKGAKRTGSRGLSPHQERWQ
jgi:hypothetical protein